MTFRPYLGLTLFTLIATAILLTLGTWQYQRLGWKTEMLANVEIAADAEPLISLAALKSAFDAGEPIDFRRIKISGDYIQKASGETPEFHVINTRASKTKWRKFRPLESEGQNIFVAAETVSDALKDSAVALPAPAYISGYVRAYQRPSRFAAKSTASANRWFSFNAAPEQFDWAMALGAKRVPTGYYIDARHFSGAETLDALPAKRPDIPNNHFDYMLTWYSFALILWVIYAILHRRAGRLKFR